MSLLKRMSCAVAVMQIASAASAQKQLPATPSEIVGGVKSCLSATTEKAVEADTLKADGWRSASIAARGKAVDSPLQFFGKGDLLLMTNKTGKDPVCVIMASVADAKALDGLSSFIMKELDVDGHTKPDEKNAIYFFPKGHIVQLARTGTLDRPSVRIIVGFMSQ